MPSGGGRDDSGAGSPDTHPGRDFAQSPTLAPDDDALGGADTAVARRSERMAAVTSPEARAVATLVGATLADRYKVTRQIGAGGMGAVFEATHTLIGKRVAVKVLLDKYAQKDQVVARLEQEAKLASSIGHEHIIDITDFGTTPDGRPFVVMEYLEGEALAEALHREGPLPVPRIVRIARQIASALGAAHDKGIVHRDVKPENVFLLSRAGTDADYVKVVDFGISKAMRPIGGAEGPDGMGGDSPRLTQTGMVLGTPLYMSPEQARGDEELDHRIDIYALGVIMYELATGEVPFRGSNYLNIVSQVLSAEVVPPSELREGLGEDFEAVVLKAMARDRDQRYQSMAELAEDLDALAASAPVGATTGSFWSMHRAGRRRSRLRVVTWVAVIAVTVAAVAVTVGVMFDSDTNPTPALAVTPPDAAPRAAAPAIDAAPPEPDIEILAIPVQSDPPGAMVYTADGVEVGTTPTVWRAKKEDAEQTLIFELEGYDDRQVSLNPLTAPTPFRVRLDKVKQGQTRKRIRRPPPPSKPGVTREEDTVGGELMGNPVRKKKRDK